MRILTQGNQTCCSETQADLMKMTHSLWLYKANTLYVHNIVITIQELLDFEQLVYGSSVVPM